MASRLKNVLRQACNVRRNVATGQKVGDFVAKRVAVVVEEMIPVSSNRSNYNI